MFHLPPILAIIILSYAYLWADRFSGGGFGWQKLSHDGGGPLRGHGTLYAGLVVILVGYLLFAVWGALIGVAWALARSCPWKLSGHSAMTPDNQDLGFALFRHAYPVLIIGVIWFVCHENGYLTAPEPFIWYLTFPPLATLLAIRNRQAVDDRQDINGTIECCRGWAFGVLTALILINS